MDNAANRGNQQLAATGEFGAKACWCNHRQCGADLLNGHTTGLWHQKVDKDDGSKLPEAEEDVDAVSQGAKHVQEGCTQRKVSVSGMGC